MAGSSAYEFARASYRQGLLSRRQLAAGAWANVAFRLRGSTDEQTDRVRAGVFALLEGVPVRDVLRLAPDVLAGILPRLYPQMLRVAYDHQDAGRPVYIVTAAAHELAALLAEVLAFDGGIGARAEIADGVYTGRPDGPFTYREGKADAIRALAAAEGIDLAVSWAYSDSESDLPMLRAVGNPVVVNPDRELTAIANAEGWRVIRFERLGRNLAVSAALGTALIAAAATRAVGARRAVNRPD